MAKAKTKKKYGVAKSAWSGLKQLLQSIALAISGRIIKVVEVPPTENALAYTAEGNMIYVSLQHEMMEGMNEFESVMFVKGLFAHELMHQLATDFAEMTRVVKTLPSREQQVFMTIFNVMEDPSIEGQAHNYFGGHLLRALSFTVMWCYRKSRNIDAEATPFSQFITALIHYGDGGFVKGEFGSDEAKQYFYRVLPIFDKAIEEKDPKKRVEYAKEVFDITRPLWEEEVKMQEFLDELAEAMAAAGKSTKSSSSSPMATPPDSEGEGEDSDGDDKPSESSSDTKAMERKKLRRKMTREKAEEEQEGADGTSSFTPSDASGDEDGKDSEGKDEEESADEGSDSASEAAVEDPSSDDAEDTASLSSTAADGNDSDDSDDSDDDPAKSSSSDGNGEDETDDASAEPTSDGDGEDDSADSSDGEYHNAPEDIKPSSPASDPMNTTATKHGNEVGAIDEEEYEIKAEDIEQIKDEIAQCEHDTKSERHEASVAEDIPDFEELKTVYPRVSCLNKVVKVSDPDSLIPMYETLVSKMSGDINMLTSHLKRIMRNADAEREYRNSGRVNIKRLSSGTMTTKVFTRRKAPENRSDVAVVIMLDESGSMSGSRALCARECAIGLAEVFDRVDIPVKIIGFTADIGNYDVNHYHYLNWINTPTERLKLLNITARANNFDGYSIRYGAKLLAKRKEQHRLLIVVSDGQPACCYYSGASGIIDTKNAVNEASKKVDVLGVAIGNSDTETLFSIYQNHFLHCGNVYEMFQTIGAKIKDIVKKW